MVRRYCSRHCRLGFRACDNPFSDRPSCIRVCLRHCAVSGWPRRMNVRWTVWVTYCARLRGNTMSSINRSSSGSSPFNVGLGPRNGKLTTFQGHSGGNIHSTTSRVG